MASRNRLADPRIRQPAVRTFKSVEGFAIRHKTAAEDEFALECKQIKAFNFEEPLSTYKAYARRLEVKDGASPTWVLRVLVNQHANLIPGPGSSCGIRFLCKHTEKGSRLVPRSRWAKAEETVSQLPIEWQRYREFVVNGSDMDWPITVPESNAEEAHDSRSTIMNLLSPSTRDLRTLLWEKDLPLSDDKAYRPFFVEFNVRISPHTKDVELAALEKVQRSGRLGYYVTWQNPSEPLNMQEISPTFFSPELITKPGNKRRARQICDDFDWSQDQAYQALKHFPHRAFFLAGCPGAGKTHWALGIAELLRLGNPAVRVLYLMDLNRSLDDVARRMCQRHRKVGFPWPVVRLRRWSYGPRKGGNKDGRSHEREGMIINVHEEFLPAVWKLFTPLLLDNSEPGNNATAQTMNIPIECQRRWRAMSAIHTTQQIASLDEAACMLLARLHQNHATISPRLLQVIKPLIMFVERSWLKMCKIVVSTAATVSCFGLQYDPEVNPAPELDICLRQLYETTLRQCPFIAATPVTAANDLMAEIFNPGVVFMDEAGHARELAALVPDAWYPKAAHIFLGDHRQTRPFSGHQHLYSEQLKVSMLERVVLAQKHQANLLTNHRAHGKVENLASMMFYDGRMISSNLKENMPLPVRRLRHWLDLIRGFASEHARLLVNLTDSRYDYMEGSTSAYNEGHREWALLHARQLLKMPWFVSVKDEKRAGRVLVVVSSKAARNDYLKSISAWSAEEKPRMRVSTMDTAAGQEADLVILDIVKQSDFSNDSNRLCVGITRAIQGEIILMKEPSWQGKHPNLQDIWDRCMLRRLSLTTNSSKLRAPEPTVEASGKKAEDCCVVCFREDCTMEATFTAEQEARKQRLRDLASQREKRCDTQKKDDIAKGSKAICEQSIRQDVSWVQSHLLLRPN